MSDPFNDHPLSHIVDPIEGTVLADSKSKHARVADHALDSGWARLRGKGVNSLDEALADNRRQAIEFLQGSWQDLDRVRHGADSQR